MIQLCCSEDICIEYLHGKLPFTEVCSRHLNMYTTTLHAINSAIVKLGKLTFVEVVYRGVAGRMLPKQFWEANEFGIKGGIETAFMSTTLNRDVALSYAAGDGTGTGFVFELQQGMVNRGADISFLSQYPHEKEYAARRLLAAECVPNRCRYAIF